MIPSIHPAQPSPNRTGALSRISLSAIIVTHDNAADIRYCLYSLPWKSRGFEAIVIDNHSGDGTRGILHEFRGRFPERRLKIIENMRNMGFAHGVNQGFANAHGRFIAVLGPDTRVLDNALFRLVSILESRPAIGIAAPQLISSCGSVHFSCRRFPGYRDLLLELTALPRLFPSRFHPSWKMPEFDHAQEKRVQQPEATCLVMRKETVKSIGFMDTRFPMFFNDVDWCYRAFLQQTVILFTPGARIWHRKAGSVSTHRISMIWKSHQGFYRFFEKYRRKAWQRILNQFIGFLLVVAALYRTAAVMARRVPGRFLV